MWEASELWGEEALCGRVRAGMEEAAAVVAWDLGTERGGLRWEEDRVEGKSRAGRREVGLEAGRSPEQEEGAGQRES